MQLKEFSLINPKLEASLVFQAIQTVISPEIIDQELAKSHIRSGGFLLYVDFHLVITRFSELRFHPQEFDCAPKLKFTHFQIFL